MSDKRRHSRDSVAFSGKLHHADGTAKDCDILDLSVGGAKISSSSALNPGATVMLGIGALGQFPTEVAWCRRPLAGLKFLDGPERMAEVVMAVATYG